MSVAAQTPPAPPAAAEPVDVALVLNGKATTRKKVEAQLSAPVRAALDAWTEPCQRLELDIALGSQPEHIVIGHASTKTLAEAAKWMDQAYELVDPLVPLAEGRTRKATVALLLDEQGSQREVWSAILDELESKRLLTREGVEKMSGEVQSLTLRSAPMFLQPTYDIAGNAAAGDDEFRLSNEVVHKFAQCLITNRTGQQPAMVLWGLGYVVENQLFNTVYHFNTAGFVSSGDHSDWRTRTQKLLEDRRKDKHFSLAALAADEKSAGQAVPPQMLTWAGLAFLSQKEPEKLRDMLSAFAVAQTEADPYGGYPAYRGDPAKTSEILAGTFDAIDTKALNDYLKKKK